LLGLLAVGGCYLSSLGVYARYEDYGGHDDGYPSYCYDCHSAPYYGSFHGCEEYVFSFSTHGYSYQPRHKEVVVVEKEVETVKYKKTVSIKEKSVRQRKAK
jgi:hypothetical protein